MSIHKSLLVGGALDQERSVLTRRERLQLLQKEGRWSKSSESVFGLPKVRTKFKVLSRKQKKAKTAEGEVAEAVPGAKAAGAKAAS
ncbi:MAG TPA: small basic protein [Planctomycetota bacterium]